MSHLVRLVAFACFLARPVLACVGDCDSRGQVTVRDLLEGIAIALGEATPENCDRMDAGGDGTVTIDEILTALTNALDGCPTEIDQAWEGPVGECDKPSITYQIRASQPLAQEFVPSLPLLGGVEVRLQAANQPFTDTLRASIYEGSLDGTEVGSASAVVAFSGPGFFWQPFSFTTPLSLELGSRYLLRLEATNAAHMWLSDVGMPPCDPASYGGGRSIIFGNFREVDLHFRTLAISE